MEPDFTEVLTQFELDEIFSYLNVRDIQKLSKVNKVLEKISKKQLGKKLSKLIDNLWIDNDKAGFVVIRSNGNIEYYSDDNVKTLGTLRSTDNIKKFYLNGRNEPYVLEKDGSLFKVEGQQYYYVNNKVQNVFKKKNGLYFVNSSLQLYFISDEYGFAKPIHRNVHEDLIDYDPNYELYADGFLNSSFADIDGFENVKKVIRFYIHNVECYILLFMNGRAEFFHKELFDPYELDDLDRDSGEFLTLENDYINQEDSLDKFNFGVIDHIRDVFLIEEGEWTGVYLLGEDDVLSKYYKGEFFVMSESVARTYNNDYNIILILKDGTINIIGDYLNFPEDVFSI